MKKNIVIIILLVIIVILVVKILNPSVVTQRKIDNNLKQEPILENVNEKTPKNGIEDAVKSPLVPEFRLQNNDTNTRLNSNIDDKYNNFSISPKLENEKFIQIKPFDQPSKQTEYNDDKLMPVKEVKSETFEDSLSLCNPYKEKLSTKYMGFNMKYSIEILGWINNKCVLNFSADISGVDSSFKDNLNSSVDIAGIFGFAPKVRCEFTKQQLLYVGDNILEESKSDRNMLKNPDEIEFPDFKDMSFSDVKLLQIILNDKACKVVNTEDLVKLFQGLFEF